MHYFVFIIYAQIYLQNFKTFDAILSFFKFTKITFFPGGQTRYFAYKTSYPNIIKSHDPVGPLS